MASKFDRKKIIWNITNFTRAALINYDFKRSVFTNWFEINVDGKTSKCRFEFYPNHRGQCYIDLKFEKSSNISVRIQLSFQLSDLSVKHYDSCYSFCLNSHEQLFNESNKFFNNDTLTVIMDILFLEACHVAYKTIQFNETDAEYFNSSTYSDFKIICRDNVEIPAHRFALTRSPVFKAMLNSDMIESTTAQVKIKDIDGAAMLEIVRYLYTGKAENLFKHGSQIIYAANKYDLPHLKKMCVDHLISNMSVANVIETLIIADENNEERLAQLCLSFIKKHYDELRASDDWMKLSMNLKDKIMDSSFKTTTLAFYSRLDG